MAASSFAAFGLLLPQLRNEPFHLVLKRFPVVLLGFPHRHSARGSAHGRACGLLPVLWPCRIRARRRNRPHLPCPTDRSSSALASHELLPRAKCGRGSGTGRVFKNSSTCLRSSLGTRSVTGIVFRSEDEVASGTLPPLRMSASTSTGTDAALAAGFSRKLPSLDSCTNRYLTEIKIDVCIESEIL